MEKTYNPSEFEAQIYNAWLGKKYFSAEVDKSKKPFTIIMPPPNITSKLHMGHAFQQTIQDIIIRRKRMQGYNALWVPGTDHAALSTEFMLCKSPHAIISAVLVEFPITHLHQLTSNVDEAPLHVRQICPDDTLCRIVIYDEPPFIFFHDFKLAF